MISTIQFGWPNEIAQILNLQEFIAKFPTNILSVDCLMISFVTGPDPAIRLNYIKLAMYSFLPIAVCLVSWVFWSIYGFCK